MPSTGSVIAGGSGNVTTGHYNVIAGGAANLISGNELNFIGGGSGNDVDWSRFSSSLGGKNNDISGADYSVLLGGENNLIKTGHAHFLGGGVSNKISGSASIISNALVGGTENKILDATYSFIGAGATNTIYSNNSVIGGGTQNIASGDSSVVFGGSDNRVLADYGVAAGRNSIVSGNHSGAFVLSDAYPTNTFSSGANTLTLNFKSGVYVDSDSGLYINGNPVLTGASGSEGDTLQIVTDRGATTTNAITLQNSLTLSYNYPRINLTDTDNDSDYSILNNDGSFGIYDVTNSAYRLQILSGGNVGIGAVTPLSRLHIGNATGSTLGLRFTNPTETVNQYFASDATDSDFFITYAGNGGAEITLQHDGKLALNASNGDNVGVGTDNPARKLEVSEGSSSIVSQFKSTAGTSAFITVANTTASADQIRFGSIGNDLVLSTNYTERFRIDSAGNVGIGSNVPSAKLDVAGGIKLLDNNYLSWNSSNTRIVGNSDYLQVQVSASDKVRVTSSGVGIGTTGPESKLHIYGGDSTETFSNITAGLAVENNGSSASHYVFQTATAGGGKSFSITNAGNVGIGLTDPDQKLHVSENIRVGDGGASDYNRIDFTRYGGAVVGGIGWHTDAHFYVAGHPSVGPTAGNTVRVYGFGADVRLGDSVNGDVLTVDATNGNVGIGTTTAPSELTVFSTDSDSATASIHCINNNATGALLRLIEGDNHQGGFLQYDGSANKFNIGVHSTNDTTFANDTKAITIDRDTAKVGIGTDNPQKAAHLYVDGNDGLRIQSSNNHAFTQIMAHTDYSAYIQFRDGANRYWIQSTTDDKLRFRPNATSLESATINFDATGKVGIGVLSPTEKLEVGTDTDVSAVIGKAHIGYMGTSNHARFSHVDFANSSQWAFSQTNGGSTQINTKSAGEITFLVNTIQKAKINGDGDFQVDTDTLYVDASADRVGINDSTPSYALDVNGTIRTQSELLGTQFGTGPCTTIDGFFASTSTEDYGFQNALLMNDLAGFTKWAGVTIATSGLYKTRGGSAGSYTYSNEAGTGDFDRAFQANNHTVGSWYTDSGPDGDITTGVASTGVIELYFNGVKSLNYSAQAAAIFGSASFRATHVKIEALRTGAWQTILDTTENDKTALIARINSNGGGANATTGLRYSFARAGNYFRINNLYAADYDLGNDLSYGGQYYIDKYYDGRHYADLRPVTDGGANLGTSSVRYGNSYIDYGRFTNNVGIGTDTLTYNLNVVSDSDILAQFKSNDNKASILIQDNDTAGYVSAENDKFSIGPNNGTHTGNLTIDLTNSRVGIGTNAPAYPLDVVGTIHGTSGNFENGITVNGNPVVTGTSAFESDTLQTVTDQGNITTNNIIIENNGNDPEYGALTISGGYALAHLRSTGTVAYLQFQNSTTSYGTMSNVGMTIGNNGHDAYINNRQALGSVYLATSGESRVAIKPNGNVGIGTVTPVSALHVVGDQSDAVQVDDGYVRIRTTSNNDAIQIQSSVGNEARILASDFDTSSPHPLKIAGDYVRFCTSGNAAATEVMRMTAEGNVGIGTTDPSQKLEVNGAIKSSQYLYLGSDVSLYRDGSNILRTDDALHANGGISVGGVAGGGFIYNRSETDSYIKFDDPNIVMMGGNVGIGTTSPAKKLSVYEAGNAQVQITGTNVSILTISDPNSHGQLNTYNDGTFRINSVANAAGTQLVLSGSNVGVGTIPTKTLDVDGDTRVKNAEFQVTSSSAYTTHLNYLDGGNNYISQANGGATIFRNSAGTLMSLNSAGTLNVGAAGVTNTRLHVTGAASDSLAKFKDGSDGVEITTRGASRQQIDFLGSNTSAINAKGSLFINYDSDNGGSNDTITFARNGVDEAGTVDMIITEGKVGIGTTDPAHQLHLNKENAIAEMQISRDGSDPSTDTDIGRIQFKTDYSSSPNEVGSIWVRTNSSAYRTDMRFGVKATAGSEEVGLTIHGTNDGPFVGVGTTNPTQTFHVKAEQDGDYVARITNTEATAGANYGLKVDGGSNSSDVTFEASSLAGTSYFQVQGDGNVGIGSTSPDAHLNVYNTGTTSSVADVHIVGSGNTYGLLVERLRNDSLIVSKSTSAGSYFKTDSATASFQGYEIGTNWFLGQYGYNDFRITDGSKSGGTAALTIQDSTQNVGIGTTSPARKLDVSTNGADTYGIRNSYGASHYMEMAHNRFNAVGNNYIRFNIDDSTKMTIVDSDFGSGVNGVGIGTTSPSYELDVVGTTRSTYYIGGAYLEENASSSKLKFYTDGTVLVMDEDGELKPCEKENDTLVFGVTKRDFDSPVVLGAEPILVTGPIKVGDYIVTSSKQGHGQAMKEEKLGTIIAQAMESGDGESYNIKAMIRKM